MMQDTEAFALADLPVESQGVDAQGGESQGAESEGAESESSDPVDEAEPATDAVLAAMSAADPEAAAALKAEWGGDFAAQVDLARRGARALATPDLVSLLEESGLGDHPVLVRAAAEIGRRLAAAGGDRGELSAPTPAEAVDAERIEAELDRLHALQFTEPLRYRSAQTQRRLSRLYQRRYGRADPGSNRPALGR